MTAVLAAITLGACGVPSGETTLKGRTSDETGVQRQGLTSGELGGSGSLSAASKIRVSRLKTDGTLELVGEGSVSSGGQFEISIPAANEKKLIAQSIDATGKVRASVIVEQSGAEGAITVLSPMTTESSVEAEVLAQLVASGVSVAEANAIDLRARINAQTAAAVKESSDAGAKVKALAEAIASAQRAQLQAYAEAGVTTTQSALFDAQLSAAAKLNVALDGAADTAASEKAYEDFVVELQAKSRAAAGDARKASRGERAASIAFRATLNARLGGADAVADAAYRHCAGLEARVMTLASEAALTAGAAAQATVDSFSSASATLNLSLRASTDVAATTSAFVAYRAALVGSTSVTGSVLGNYLEVDAITAASVQTAVDAIATAAVQLDLSIQAAATASLSATGTINFVAYTEAVVQALKTFDAAVEAQTAALAAFGSKASVALELMAQANGTLRVAN
jgi:hypothetical protein